MEASKTGMISRPVGSSLTRRELTQSTLGIVLGLVGLNRTASAARWPQSSMMHHGNVEIDGGRLFYVDHGQGKPIILIPPFGLDSRTWDDQISALAARRRVICYDPRGFGRSSEPRPQVSYSHQDDLLVLFSKLGLGKADIVGIGNGARIAVGYALKFPNAVQSLVLVTPSVDGTCPLRHSPLFQSVSKVAQSLGVAEAKEILLERLEEYQADKSRMRAFNHLRHILTSYSGWHLTRSDPEVPSIPNAIDRLDELSIPLLTVRRTDASECVQKTVSAFGRLRGTASIVLEESYGLPYIERSSKFSAHVFEFFSRVS